MGKKLDDKTKHWMGLERATFEQRAIAEEYYDNELMRLIVKEFILHNKDKIYEKADYMILSVGTSYEPLVLNISLFQPKKILFLYTEKTEVTIDKIVDFCALPSSAYQKELVNEVNPLDIYKQIKDAYLQWHTPDKIYIDFTGGTKAMSAAAAMVGAVIDLQLIYIGSENYLPDFRKPLPGSETLYFINNPYTVFGDFEIEKAMQLFEQYNYSGAKNKLGELYEKIPDPVIRQQLHFSYLLAETYEHWDALEFEQSYNDMDSLVKELHRDMKFNPQFLLMDCIGILHEQLKILDALKDIQKLFRSKNHMAVLSQTEYIMPLMFTMQANALIREEQEKYDSATLLLYRLLEMAGQRRLSIYGIDVSGADFLNIKYNIQQLPEMKDLPKEKQLEMYKERVVKIKTQVFGRCNSSYMPEQISLLDGFIHLSALNDSIMTMGDGNCINKLKRLRSVVYLRNNSIFAHGFSPVSKTDYEKFKLFVIELFKQLCILEKIDYTEYCEKMKWVNPAYTKNYSMGVKPCQ